MRAPDVAVLDESDAVGDAGFRRVAQRRIQPGVRHADDDVRLERDGASARNLPGALARGSEPIDPVYDRNRGGR